MKTKILISAMALALSGAAFADEAGKHLIYSVGAALVSVSRYQLKIHTAAEVISGAALGILVTLSLFLEPI